MARYIDADKLLEETTLNVLPNSAWFVYLAMRGMVIKAPTADVVEVVRCEKCSFYEEVEYYHPTDKNPTKKICRLLKRQTHENDFCSYGERNDT